MNPFEHIQLILSPQQLQDWRVAQAQQRREAEVPPRVKVAMEMLQRLSYKTGKAGIAHGLGCEVIDGQSLTKDEMLAMNTFLQVLRDYATGKLRECRWDRPQADDPQGVSGLLKVKIKCPACTGRNGMRDQTCGVCGGVGEVQTVRINREQP